jgi:hypothetical protein
MRRGEVPRSRKATVFLVCRNVTVGCAATKPNWVQMFWLPLRWPVPDVGYARCRRTKHMIPPARRQRPRGRCFTACPVSRSRARQSAQPELPGSLRVGQFGGGRYICPPHRDRGLELRRCQRLRIRARVVDPAGAIKENAPTRCSGCEVNVTGLNRSRHGKLFLQSCPRIPSNLLKVGRNSPSHAGDDVAGSSQRRIANSAGAS